jgi:hypothetical protein
MRKIFLSQGFDPQTIQAVASCCTEYAIPDQSELVEYLNKIERQNLLVQIRAMFCENHIVLVSFEHGDKTFVFHKWLYNQIIDLLIDYQHRKLVTLKITAVTISTTYFIV